MKPDAYSGEARLGRIRDKEAVINELSYVDPMTPSLGETVKKLRDKLYACGSCGHDDNIRLKNEFESAADRLFKERDRIREEYKRQKEGIILEVERLSYSTDYKSAKDQMQSLRERWKQIPRGAKADEDVLWFRFKQASDRLYENAKNDYEERKRKQADAKYKKEFLVRQVESLSYSTDFKNAKDQMKHLSEQWKQAPRASKEDEDQLWSRFRQAADRLYGNAQQDYERLQAQQREAKARKEQVINQIEK